MLEFFSSALWGWHVLLLILGVGIFFTVKTGGFQFRGIFHWMKASLGGEKNPQPQGGKPGGISSFQALTTALAGSIGTGNIVGVATAITCGGPGALFWMWVSAALGMMTVFGENLLAAKYKNAPGALGYIEKAGKWGKKLAVVYAVGCCLSSLGMGNMIQTNACAGALETLGVPLPVSGLVLGGITLAVALGGMGFAVKITEKLVPLMTGVFLLASLGVLWVFRENLPQAFQSIFASAFSLKAGAGGVCGMLLALRHGVSRGVFTNEAGLGSASFAYEGVKGKTPVELGCMGIFQVFMDTIVMCTLTGLCILCCRSPMLEGVALTFYAYESALGPLGNVTVSLCTALFAVATVVAWCCYGRESLLYLTKGRGKRCYGVVCGVAACVGCLLPLGQVFQLGDAFNGLMALTNVPVLLLCGDEVKKELQKTRARKIIK